MKTVVVLLTLLRGGMVLAIPLVAGWMWLSLPTAPVLTVAVDPAPSAKETELAEAHDLNWYAPLWERDWKEPPIPPAPAAPPPTPDPGPVPALLATLVEPSGRYAHFQGASGRAELKTLGETVGRYRIMAIEPGRVQLQDGVRVFWVEVPKPATVRR